MKTKSDGITQSIGGVEQGERGMVGRKRVVLEMKEKLIREKRDTTLLFLLETYTVRSRFGWGALCLSLGGAKEHN